MTIWTASSVEERLQEAARTLRRLPPVRVQGYFNLWPHVLHDANDKRDWETQIVPLGPPDAAAISRMEETLVWFQWLSPDENRLVWMRATNTRWKVICAMIGCCRTAAWQRWVYALTKLACALNERDGA